MKQARPRLALALSVLGLCHSASAQSSVSIYGIADLAVEHIGNIAPAPGGNITKLISGGQAGSRLGFKGTEDLGAGSKAFFVLESGFAMDTGELLQGGRAFGRLALVGLQSQWGSLALGRNRNTVFDVTLPFDPMGYSAYSLLSTDPFVAARVDNAVQYFNSVGPVRMSAIYSFGYDSMIPNGSEVANNSKVGRSMGASLVYAKSGFSAMLAYNQQQGASISTQDRSEQRWVGAATYERDRWKVHAGMMTLHRSIAPTLDRRTYWTGFGYKLTPFVTMRAGIYRHDVRSKSNADSTLYSAALLYALSKRSSLYASAGFAFNQAQSAQGVEAPATVVAGEGQRGVVLGMIHTF